MSTYVVSDLHGQYEVFRRGLKEIGFGSEDFLYVIGDVIDRGPDGIRLLREIKRKENMDLIPGNHEYMMLNSVDPEGKPRCEGRDARLWLHWNGGNATFEKYKRNLRPKDRKELLEWLWERCLIKPVTVEGRYFVLGHSYYIEEHENKAFRDISDSDAWDIVWRSVYRHDPDTWCRFIYGGYPDRLFITGHVPVQHIREEYQQKDVLPHMIRVGNLINIDGGLAYGFYGILNSAIFLRLEDLKEFVVPLIHEETKA